MLVRGTRHHLCFWEGQLSQTTVVGTVPGKASLVRYYERLAHILASPSSRDILYLKLIPRFLTETPLVICTGAGR